MRKLSPLLLTLFLAAFCFNSEAINAQTYPNKTIRFITSPAGGGGDLLSRIIAQGISPAIGQSIIVDNRSTAVVGDVVAQAQPDGYTALLIGNIFWMAPLMQKTQYDVEKDFLPVAMVGTTPNVLVVHPSVGVKSVGELIALAKAKPGVLNYATSGPGSSAELAAELFKSMASVKIVGVPYKGAGPAMNALMGGDVQVMFVTAPSATASVKSGKLTALAVTSAKPSPFAPGLPTVAATLPGFDSVSMYGVFFPAKTPNAVVTTLNQDLVRVLGQTEIKDQILKLGVQAISSTPQELADYIKSDMTVMGKVIKDAGITTN